MKNSWISSLLLLFLFCLPLLAQEPQPSAHSQEDMEETIVLGKELQRIVRILRAYRPWEAHEELEKTKLPEPLKHLLRGWAHHQEGNYKEAELYFSKVDKNELQGSEYFANRLVELSKTASELKNFSVLETENFSFRYQKGPDEVMLHLLPQILEEVYARYSEIFNYVRDEKIIVELMPDHRLFSYASALTRTQIETTGTIALCVENRLVVLTPRRVLQGYYWPDVIAHEFVHYILTKLSGDQVPLWMQEGVAKYFEARWENDHSEPLDHGMETSLAMAIKNDSLLTVEEMMPSFAALPTAELARQAYAQTASMIDYIGEAYGEKSVNRIVVGLRADGDMDRVMSATINKTFQEFETDWRAWMKTKGYRNYGEFEAKGVSLLDRDQGDEKIKEVSDTNETDKRHLRLGDLLLERNRYSAALKQYTKVSEDGRKSNRQIVLRMLSCYTNLDQNEQIVQLIDTHTKDLQNDTTMLVHKATALMGMEKLNEATRLLERALRINPFNPRIYQNLYIIQKETGTEDDLNRLKKIMSTLAKPSTPAKERKS